MEVYRIRNDELYHSGSKGMKWGRRLYQNKDGSLTPLGRVHYGVGTPRGEAQALAKRASQAAGNAASNAIDRTERVATRAAYTIDSNVSPARNMSSFDTSSRRASDLGESGTGVRRRASINGRHSINYNDSLDTISPALTIRGKNTLNDSALRDATMDSIREREVTQIGRFYTEQFYKGTGGYGVSSINSSDRGTLANYYARKGRSQTGGESPYSYYKNTKDTLQTRNIQDNEYESLHARREMKARGASKADIEKRMKEIDARYDKEWDDIERTYGKRRR